MNPQLISPPGGWGSRDEAEHAAAQEAYLRAQDADWITVRARYVEGFMDGVQQAWPTLAEVAEHFELHPKAVQDRSATEGWVARRQKFQAEADRARQRAKQGALAKRAVDLDARALSAAELGVNLALARLGEIAAARQPGGTSVVGANASAIDARELAELARGADLWHRIGARALGDTSVEGPVGSDGRGLDIEQELGRGDVDRLGAVLAVLERAGIQQWAGERDAVADGRQAEIAARR